MSTTNALATRQEAQITELPRRSAGDIMFEVLAKGDLDNLTPEEIARYLVAVCESVGLNPLTKPFDVITIPGNKRTGTPDRKVLYANRNAGDQLTKLYNITRQIVSRELVDGVYVVTARVTTPDGRSDEAIGAVPLMKENGKWKPRSDGEGSYFEGDGTYTPLPPDQRSNKIMHAETKAKRRAILSLVGLSLLDESELDTMRGTAPVAAEIVDPPRGIRRDDAKTVDAETGEVFTPIADRDTEARALMDAIGPAFGLKKSESKRAVETAENLICWRFGYAQSRQASAEEIAEVRAGIEDWQRAKWVTQGYDWLAKIAAVDSENMAIDIGLVLDESQVDDPFIHAALADRLAAFERAAADMAAVAAAAERAVQL